MTAKKRQTSKAPRSESYEAPGLFVIPGHAVIGPEDWSFFNDQPDLVVTRDENNRPRIVRVRELSEINDRLTDREILAAADWTVDRHDVEAGNYIASRASDRRLAARAHHHGEAVRLLGARARHIVGLLGELASNGDASAIHELAAVAAAACKSLRNAEKMDLRRVREVARKWNAWPVMLSPVKTLNEGNCEIPSDIQLGKDLPIDVRPKAGWRKDRPGTDIAAALLSYLVGWWESSTETGAEIRKLLKPLSRDSVGDWWAFAWAFLKQSYPDTIAVPELRKLAGRLRGDGQIRSRIEERLKARFLAIARKVALAYPT